MRYSYRSSTPVWAIIAINTFVFIITTANPNIGDSLALTKPIFGSNYWTILTAMFVHANFLHIFSNMLTFYFFGTFCLQLIDTKRFLAVYFIGGIIGNILFLLIGPTNSEVVGASGAIYAIGGVLAIMRPTQRVYLYFLVPLPLWVVIIFGFLITAFIGGVAWQSHLGGLIVGLIAGFFFRRIERQRLKPGYYRW
jgi:membrane associated rhomboid family serine protease